MDKHADLIVKTFTSTETKAVDGSPRTLVAKISTQTPDRSKDIMVQDGVVLDNFLKNPVVMYAHDYQSLPIAKCLDIKVADGVILATVQFPDEGTYDKADVVYKLYKEGFMNAWSVGYIGLDVEPITDGGLKYNKWELYEFSAVPIPDNPEALTVMRSKGINVDCLLKTKEIVKNTPPEEGTYTDDTKVSDLTVAQLKDVIEDVIEAGDDDDNEVEDEKSVPNSMIKRLTSQLKVTDKSVGLTLRLLKTIKSESIGKEEHEVKAAT